MCPVRLDEDSKLARHYNDYRSRFYANVRSPPFMDQNLVQTSKLPCSLSLCDLVKKSKLDLVASLNWLDPKSVPDSKTFSFNLLSEMDHRKRPNIWICDGLKANVDAVRAINTDWKLGILMSYPVNERHLVLHANGSDVCATLQNVFTRLEQAVNGIPNALKQVFLTDVFPFAGHPSSLGAQQMRHLPFMQEQTRSVLDLLPRVLLICGGPARKAFFDVVSSEKCYLDLSASLGIPSCFVHWKGKLVLVLIQGHPCKDMPLKPATNISKSFDRRMQLISLILSGSFDTKLPLGDDLEFRMKHQDSEITHVHSGLDSEGEVRSDGDEDIEAPFKIVNGYRYTALKRSHHKGSKKYQVYEGADRRKAKVIFRDGTTPDYIGKD